jgi:hypothetical protein
MASGPVGSPSTGMKFFLYAKSDEDILLGKGGDLFLVQLIMQSSSGDMTVTLKTSSSDSQVAAQMLATLKQGLDCFSPN